MMLVLLLLSSLLFCKWEREGNWFEQRERERERERKTIFLTIYLSKIILQWYTKRGDNRERRGERREIEPN